MEMVYMEVQATGQGMPTSAAARQGSILACPSARRVERPTCMGALMHESAHR